MVDIIECHQNKAISGISLKKLYFSSIDFRTDVSRYYITIFVTMEELGEPIAVPNISEKNWESHVKYVDGGRILLFRKIRDRYPL